MLLIFDMDGTVLDSMKDLESAASTLISTHYDMPLEQAVALYRHTTGVPFAEQLQMLFPNDRKNGHVARTYEETHRVLCSTAQLAPQIEDVLWNAVWAKHRLALVTSTDHTLIDLLPQVRNLPWSFIGGFKPGYAKPQQIRRALDNLVSDDVVYRSGPAVLFGDTESDRQCAARAGIEFFLVTPDRVAGVVREVLRRARP